MNPPWDFGKIRRSGGQNYGLRLEGNEGINYIWNWEDKILHAGNKKFKGLELLLMCSRNDKNAL